MMGKNQRRYFWCAWGVTLSLIILLAGSVQVDYQGRKMTFGQGEPPFSLLEQGGRDKLEIRLFGGEAGVDVTEISNFWDFLCDFGCIPHR